MRQSNPKSRHSSQTKRASQTGKQRARAPKRIYLTQLARALEQGPTSVLAIDTRGNIEYVNARFSEITGYSRDELVGKPIRMLTSDDMPKQRYVELLRLLMAGNEWRGELHSRKKNGESFWVAVAIKPMANRRRRITHFLILGEDITERKKIEEELRQSETQFRTLFERVPDGMYRSSPDGKLLAVNPALVRMLGYASEEELLPVDIGRQLYRDPKQRAALLKKLESVDDIHNTELTLTRKDGQPLVVIDNTHVVRDAAGRVLYYEGTLTDITERKRDEEDLARYAAILNAVNFAAEQFLRAPSWREHIAQVIGRLGRATRVSRVYIFENRHTETKRLVWRQIYEWVATGVSTQIDNPVLLEFDVLAQGFERWIALMEKGELVKGKVKDLPPGEQAELVAEEIKSIVCVPIFVKQVWWGFIGFDDCLTEREWSAAELDALIAAASTLGAAIEREQSDREQQMRANELEAIRQASLSLTATLDLGTVLETVCESTLRLTPEVNDVHIFLYPGERLEFGASLWMDGKKNVMWSEPRPDGLTYTVARSGKRIVVPDMRTSPLFAAMQWRGAIIGMPLKIAQRVVGVMTIAYEKPRTFSENELRTLDLLAAQAAIAIENASLYDQVQQLAVTDPLTNIYNRRGFFQIGDSEIERARRFGHPLSALMFDLDYFKQFNDTFGHPFGDKILVALVEVCRRNIRTLDILGRYGGEEFAVLLPETDSATAAQIAERVREAVEKTQMQIDDRVISITISIGVATLHDGVFDLTALLDQADQALYRAKQAGRNRVELFTPLG